MFYSRINIDRNITTTKTIYTLQKVSPNFLFEFLNLIKICTPANVIIHDTSFRVPLRNDEAN